ncbi:hypothetical protein BB558_002805, partial [Smittium angustum]
MDETGIQINNTTLKVLGIKGSSDICQLTSGEKGKTTSVIVCTNAEGTFLPPYIILKDVRSNNDCKKRLPPGSK